MRVRKRITNTGSYSRETLKEYWMIIVRGLLIDAAAAYLVYGSLIASLFLFPAAVLLIVWDIRAAKKKKEEELTLEFRDGILALAASLRSGHSAENSFLDAAKEVELLHGKSSRIAEEFRLVKADTEISVPLETAILNMAHRCRIPEIQTFAGILSAARRTGGNISRIIADTSETISGKIEVQAEIMTGLHGRRYELGIMKIIPPVMILYLKLTSPGYLDPLYSGFTGRIVMTAAFLVYACAWVTGEKMMTFEI